MKYKIFTDDGIEHNGDTLNPNIITPSEFIQVIVMPNPDGGIMTATGCDYYMLDQRTGDTEPRWYGGDISGLFQYLKRTGLVKFGWQLNSKAYRDILEKASRVVFE